MIIVAYRIGSKLFSYVVIQTISIFFTVPIYCSALPKADEVAEALFRKGTSELRSCEIRLSEFLSKQSNSQEIKDRFVNLFWNRKDSVGLTPLQWALMLVVVTDNHQAISFLLDRGAQPQTITKAKFDDAKKSIVKSRMKGVLEESKLPMFLMKIEHALQSNQSFYSMVSSEGDYLPQKIKESIIKKFKVTDFDSEYVVHDLIMEKKFDLLCDLLEDVPGINVNQKLSAEKQSLVLGFDESTPLHLLVTHSARHLNHRKGEKMFFREIKKQDRFQGMPEAKKIERVLEKLIKRGADPRIESRVFKQTPVDLIGFMGDRRLIQKIYELCRDYSPDLEIKKWADLFLLEQSEKVRKAQTSLLEWEAEYQERRAQHINKRRTGYQKSQIEEPRQDALSSEEQDYFLEEEKYDWELITQVREKVSSTQKAEEEEQSFKAPKAKIQFTLPSVIHLPRETMPVNFSRHFFSHVEKRNQESGNHDLSDEEIFETSSEPNLILERKYADGLTKRIFVGINQQGGYNRVVYSKKPRQGQWHALTAYRSDNKPFYEREEVLDDLR